MNVLRYEGSVAGLRKVLREIRKTAMAGVELSDVVGIKKLQRRLDKLQL